MQLLKTDRTLVALAIGFALLAAFMIANIALNLRQKQAYMRVSHTISVENRLGTILSRIQDAETGQRGYLLTRRDEFLGTYRDSEARIGGDLAALQREVADNPRQGEAAAALRRAVAERQAHLDEVISKFRATGRVDQRLLLIGRRQMDGIRARVEAMKAEEERLLRERYRTVRNLAQLVIAGLVFTAFAVVLLGWAAFQTARRQLNRAVSARDALEAANERLRMESESRRLAEDQTRQLQKMDAVGRLTGGIAHDFNNMLAIIIGSLDMAGRRLAQNQLDRVHAGIAAAREGAERAALLTSRLLAFSRQQPLEPQALDANKLVGGMSELLRRSIGEQLQVETVLAGGLWRICADPSQLENAILNLCVNARDSMPGGGRLTIETANAHLDDDYGARHEVEPGQYVMVSVSDTGSGMPPDVIERAFEPFYTTKGAGQGTGLGLSQVFGFVRQSRGHVKIYSEPGQGSAVKIYLPRHFGAEAAAAADERETLAEVLPRAVHDETILVVEDEERVRQVSVDALRELGYIVVQAADGQRALALLEAEERIDLLFTDVVMPGMNGRELADEVAGRWPDVRVLYTTGYTRNAIVHNGMLDAGVAFLAKPFTIGQLAAKVRQVLDKESVAAAAAK
jgi:signal transduction histidine kinase/ActR/RegA family two-component response regulator